MRQLTTLKAEHKEIKDALEQTVSALNNAYDNYNSEKKQKWIAEKKIEECRDYIKNGIHKKRYEALLPLWEKKLNESNAILLLWEKEHTRYALSLNRIATMLNDCAHS